MTGPGERSYYIEEYSDEVVPCDCTLEGWAAWLSKPAPEWGRPAAAPDGHSFEASVLVWEEDVIATRGSDGEWSLSRDFDGGDCIAVRFGPGLGWDAESIVYDRSGLLEYLKDNDGGVGAVEHVAIGRAAPNVRLLFKADPPRLIVQGTVQ